MLEGPEPSVSRGSQCGRQADWPIKEVARRDIDVKKKIDGSQG